MILDDRLGGTKEVQKTVRGKATEKGKVSWTKKEIGRFNNSIMLYFSSI